MGKYTPGTKLLCEACGKSGSPSGLRSHACGKPDRRRKRKQGPPAQFISEGIDHDAGGSFVDPDLAAGDAGEAPDEGHVDMAIDSPSGLQEHAEQSGLQAQAALIPDVPDYNDVDNDGTANSQAPSSSAPPSQGTSDATREQSKRWLQSILKAAERPIDQQHHIASDQDALKGCTYRPLSSEERAAVETRLNECCACPEHAACTCGLGNRAAKVFPSPLQHAYTASMYNTHFIRLKGSRWLGDEVINGVVDLLNHRQTTLRAEGANVPRVLLLNTFFYEKLTEVGPGNAGIDFKKVCKWFKPVRMHRLGVLDGTCLLTHDLVIFPVNIGNYHWICVLIDIRQRKIYVLDPMIGAQEANNEVY